MAVSAIAEKKKAVTFSLVPEYHKKMKILAVSKDITIREYLENLVVEDLEKKEQEGIIR